MTLLIARDLARRSIRNMTITPGIFGTPMLHLPNQVMPCLRRHLKQPMPAQFSMADRNRADGC